MSLANLPRERIFSGYVGESMLASLYELNRKIPKSDLLDHEIDNDTIDEYIHDAPWKTEPIAAGTDMQLLPFLFGDASFVQAMTKLCQEYSDVFGEHVRPEPALSHRLS
jgi:hypothetical protein